MPTLTQQPPSMQQARLQVVVVKDGCLSGRRIVAKHGYAYCPHAAWGGDGELAGWATVEVVGGAHDRNWLAQTVGSDWPWDVHIEMSPG